jgi:hypothetical protein
VAAGSPRFADVGQLAAAGQPTAQMTGGQLRAMMISEYCQWLRSRINKEKRPFQEETITAYKVAARRSTHVDDVGGPFEDVLDHALIRGWPSAAAKTRPGDALREAARKHLALGQARPCRSPAR